jgi:hypothetical protein
MSYPERTKKKNWEINKQQGRWNKNVVTRTGWEDRSAR